jgi:hypothetical protein
MASADDLLDVVQRRLQHRGEKCLDSAFKGCPTGNHDEQRAIGNAIRRSESLEFEKVE